MWSRSRALRRGLIGVVSALGIAEIVVRLLVQSRYIPAPSAIAGAIGSSFGSGGLGDALVSTTGSVVLALLFATVIGVVLGILFGVSANTYRAVRVVVEFLRPVPAVSVLPFAILALGVGSTAALVVATYAALWPVLFNTYYGVRDADPVALDTARSLGLSRGAMIRRVVLPLASRSIMTGVRVSSAIALVLVVTAELLTSSSGLGYFITFMQSANRIPEMYVGVVMCGLIGMALTMVLAVVERRVTFWHHRDTKDRR